MIRFASLMNGWTATRTKSILLWTHDRLSSWWKNTVLEAIQAALKYDYRFASGIAMWALRRRWHIFKMRWPVYKKLHEMEKDYWHLYDEWDRIEGEYRLLYAKYMDLHDEVKYWETRHARIMNYIEKKMELDDTWGK